jgi:hypothetical protein
MHSEYANKISSIGPIGQLLVPSWQCDSLKRVDVGGYLVAAVHNLVRLARLRTLATAA